MGEAKRRKLSGAIINDFPRATVRRVVPGELHSLIEDLVDGCSGEQEDFQGDLELLLRLHFPGLEGLSEDDDLSCDQCIDHSTGVCPGRNLRGEAVILDCFSEKMGKEITIAEGFL